LSYRDLVAMMAERGVVVSHTTIHRWVIRYVPEFEKRWNRFARPVNTSWQVDETYINIRGKFSYLYRAVDKQGKTVDFLLRPDRGIAAAQAFFRKALSTSLPRRPRKITLDGHLQSKIIERSNADAPRWWEASSLRVTQANLGSSTRLALRLGAIPRMWRPDRFSAGIAHFERL
jgi:transposase-like protein